MSQIKTPIGNKEKDANALASRMQQQRQEKSRSQQRFIEKRPILVEGIEDERIYGRDERGRKVDLKTKKNGSMVQLGFNREIIEQMGADFKEGDPIPRKIFYCETDIYNAVRSLKHMRKSHDLERERNERLANAIDQIHAILYTKNAGLKSEEILHLSSQLDSIAKAALKKTSGYKLLAKWKLDAVPDLLRNAAKEENAFKRTNLISSACAKLVAFKERHNRWRERQILRIDRYNAPREEGLRLVRDKRLSNLLIELSGTLVSNEAIKVGLNLAMDWEVIKKLRKAGEKITQGKHHESLLLIEESSKHIKSEYERSELGVAYSLIESSISDGKNGWRKDARSLIENFARKIGQRNPRYIIIELKKTNDKYLESAIGQMEQGNALIRESLTESRFWMKKKLLKQAALAYRQAAIGLAIK